MFLSLQVPAEVGEDGVDGEGEYGSVEFVTRNDQLKFKQAAKTKHGKGPGPKTAKGGKTGKKGRKSKKGKKPRKVAASKEGSPSKRKLETLRQANQTKSVVEEDWHPEEDVEPKKPKRSKGWNTDTSAATAKPKGKAKSKAANTTRKTPKAAKAKAQPKVPSSGSGKGRGRGRGRGARAASGAESDLFDVKLVDQFNEFGKLFDRKASIKSPKFKSQVRANVAEPEHFSYNNYWSRTSCGVKSTRQDKDIAHFIFTQSSAPDAIKCAIAVKCAEIYAT